MSEKEQLIATIANARRKLDKIEDAERAEQARAFIGKCYRYHNSYSSGERWWLYVKVLRMERDGTLVGHQFQHTAHNIYEIEPMRRFYHGHVGGGYEEITGQAFNKAWADTLRALTKVKP